MALKTLTPKQWLEYYNKHPDDFEAFLDEVKTETHKSIATEKKLAALKTAAKDVLEIAQHYIIGDAVLKSNLSGDERIAIKTLADLLKE